MNEWIAAANPRAVFDTESRALKGARWSAIALWISGTVCAVQTWHVRQEGAAILDAAREVAIARAQSEEEVTIVRAMMSHGMIDMMIIFGVAMTVFAAVLGLIQWFRPNRFVPLICLLVVVYGVVSGLVGLMLTGRLGAGVQGMAPWSIYLGYVAAVVTLVLHIAGLRGASALKRLRD